MSYRDSATTLLSRAGLALDGAAPHDPRIVDESIFRDVFIWGSLGLGDGYVAGKWECDALDVFFERVLGHGLEHRIGRGADLPPERTRLRDESAERASRAPGRRASLRSRECVV